VFDCLRASGCALCINDEEQPPWTELVGTTDWGYARLRCEAYTDQSLADWIAKMKAHTWARSWPFASSNWPALVY
jgi:hypothetical protein